MGLEGGEHSGPLESERQRLARKERERLARQERERSAHAAQEREREVEARRIEVRREHMERQSAFLTRRFRDGLDRIEAARQASAEELRHETVFQELRQRCTGILADVDLCLQDAEFWQGLKDGWLEIHRLNDDLIGRLEPFLWVGLPPLLEAVGYRTPPPPPIMEVVTGIVEAIADTVAAPGDEAAAVNRIDEVREQLFYFTRRARLQLDLQRPETLEEIGKFRRGVEEVARVGGKLGGPVAIAGGHALDSFAPGAGAIVEVAVQGISEYRAGLAAVALTETDELDGPPGRITHPGAGQARDWVAVHRAALFVALQQAWEAGERMAQGLSSAPATTLKSRQDSWDDHRVAIDAVSLHLGEIRQLLPEGRLSQRLQDSIARLDSLLDEHAQRVSAASPPVCDRDLWLQRGCSEI